jgi:hypothetical protein
MIVARQFIAWNTFENGNRPVGHGISMGPIPGNKLPGYDHLVPYGTESLVHWFQAMNCLRSF